MKNKELQTLRERTLIVLEIKFELIRLFADLAEMKKYPNFVRYLDFGATDRLSRAVHFFSPAQYTNQNIYVLSHLGIKTP